MKCRICKKEIELSYGDGLNNKLKLLKICFDCNFWIEKFEEKNSVNVARIKNNHYIIGKESYTGERGFAGRQFKIKFFEKIWIADKDNCITTTNLWHQGEIPERFRKYLPNNAEFIETE